MAATNPGCYIDSINNENITYGRHSTILNGEYKVRVDYYSDCVEDSLPTKYTVTARYKGNLVTPSTGSNPYSGSFAPLTSDGGNENSGVEAMTFDIGAGSANAIKVAEIKFPSAALTAAKASYRTLSAKKGKGKK